MRPSGIVVVCSLLLSCHVVTAINFRLPANEEMCFHEMTHKGNMVVGFFEVLTWGYGSYVYMKATSPSDKTVHVEKAAAEGKLEFVAEEDGEYSFCFKGAHGTKTDVKFWVSAETDLGLTGLVKEEHVSDMTFSVERLSSLVNAARTDLQAFKSREARHRRMAMKNRRRVTFWAIVECLLIIVVAAAQIFRVQKFLENKRTV